MWFGVSLNWEGGIFFIYFWLRLHELQLNSSESYPFSWCCPFIFFIVADLILLPLLWLHVFTGSCSTRTRTLRWLGRCTIRLKLPGLMTNSRTLSTCSWSLWGRGLCTAICGRVVHSAEGPVSVPVRVVITDVMGLSCSTVSDRFYFLYL